MNQELLDGFSENEIAAVVEYRKAEIAALGTAVAMRRRHRAQTRRAKSDDEVAKLLPPRIAPDESWHLLSTGDVDVLSIVRHLVAGAGFITTLFMSTWRINKEDLKQIEAWLDAGIVEEFHLLIDIRFQRLAPDEYALASLLADEYGGSVTMCLNHSKVSLLLNEAASQHLVIESSANVNTNRRLEQSAVHNSTELFAFYSKAFNEIRLRHTRA